MGDILCRLGWVGVGFDWGWVVVGLGLGWGWVGVVDGVGVGSADAAAAVESTVIAPDILIGVTCAVSDLDRKREAKEQRRARCNNFWGGM